MKKSWKHGMTTRTLWGLAKSEELHLSGEELHLIVKVQTGKESIKQLTQKEIERVAFVLMKMKDSAKGGKKARIPTGNTTENQRRKVYKLMQELGWNEARVNGMCRRMFQVDVVEWLDYQQMSKLIEAMKAMSTRGKERAGEGLQDGAGS